MAISHDMVEDNKFRVELLECAKSLNLKSDGDFDYIKELFDEIPLEYYHVQEDMENESIIHSTKVEGGEECKDHCISKQFLFEKFIDTDDASTLLTDVLSEIKDMDFILCDNLENVITRDSIELEEPLFPKKMRLDDNFINYKVPTIKSLTPNYNSTQIPEPFIEGDMQTYTIEDLCPLYHEAMEDEITSATSLLKEQEVDRKNEIIFIDLKLENKYFEEPLSSSKAIVCKQQDIPNSMSELISLFNEEIELILPNDGQNSVIEESGIKLTLETMNKWERVEDDTIDDSGETLSNNSNESATILNIPSSREMYELEPVLIPAKNNPLEMGRRRHKKETLEEDIITTDSLMTVINHIIPENAVPTPSKQDEDEELQKDLDNMIKVETPFDQWQFIIMQPMDEICGLKFKVPLLPHPVTYISSDIPSRLSDLVISNSSKSDFQILAPFSGLKALELILHWDPIKNFVILKIEEIVDVSDTPYDDLTKIIQEENICFDSDNLLDLIDFKITNESEEIHLRSKKEKKKDKKLKQKESATGFNAPRVKSAAITTFSNLLSEMRNNHNDANYSQMKTPNYNDSSLANFSQMKASNHDSSLINYSQMKTPNYNDNSMIIYSQMKAPNNDSSVANYSQMKTSNYNDSSLTNYSRTKAPNYNDSSLSNYSQMKTPNYNDSSLTNYSRTKAPNYNDSSLTNYSQTKAPNYNDSSLTNYSQMKASNHNSSLINYSQMKAPNYNDSSLTNYSQMKAPNGDSSLTNYSQTKAPNYNDNSMIIYSQMKAPNNDSSVANYSQMKTSNNDSSLTNYSQMKTLNNDSPLTNYSRTKAPNSNNRSLTNNSRTKASNPNNRSLTNNSRTKASNPNNRSLTNNSRTKASNPNNRSLTNNSRTKASNPNNRSLTNNSRTKVSNPNNRLLTNNSRTKAPNSNKSSNRKKKQSKPNKQNESVDIQQLLRKPTIGSFRNVGNSMPNVMSWIQEENEDDVNLPEFVNESISGQDRVTQWLSSCLKSKNDYNDIEVIDLTQNTDLPTPEKYAVDNSLVIDLTQDTDLSTPEKYAVDNTQVVDLPTPEKSAVDNSSIETSPYFKNKSSVEQNHHNAIRFSNSFSATRSIDDFLILRGKLSAEKRREIEQNNERTETVAIGKSILEQLSMPVVPHKYIVSVRMFPNRRLLTALKSKDCKVDLIERDFEYMKPFLLEEKSEVIHVEVDFIIDERTGVIFYPLNMLSQDQSVLKLVQTILRLHLKYPNLYVILETYTWNNRSTNSNMEYTISTYPFTLPILRSTSELRLILMCCNCNATIMFSLCEEMSAKLLRMIGDSCATRCDREGVTRIGNHGWKDHKQWEGRDWMTMEESLHERFLSCFTPLINPFTAQIILTATTLLQFFQMSHLERCALVGGWIDESRLKKFDEIIHEILSIDSINDTEQTLQPVDYRLL